MIALLLNFVLMGAILTGLLKAYYDVPFLNENPTVSGSVGLMILLVIIWIFPKIIGFVVKLVGFACVVYLICHTMGWDLDFLKSRSSEAISVAQELGDDIADKIDEVKMLSEPNRTFTAGVSAVNSGYTLQVGDESVQLYGIDAPDNAQTCKNQYGVDYNCGDLSRQKLGTLVNNQQVSCESKGTNRAGNTVASCFVDGEDVAAMMVRSGWAVANRKVSETYVADEKSAHDQKVGMWEGKFQAPWDWRSNNSDAEVESTSDAASKATPFQKLMNFFTK